MRDFCIWLVRAYQRYLSPLFPATCRYRPTCSAYMIEALEKHGLKGLLMGLSRILRCHPFVAGGDDPVPDVFTLRRSRQDKKHSK
ncbi:membrane protein insertion efficiency factor YidD [Streptococcus sp. zg-JUN1979]|uniref:membrane protein insertion efficiency factor YidD n=1 Tax=Streptococcus sp. zg-JUN1979 TaxID=3391450 RepID=UPI0039A6B135